MPPRPAPPFRACSLLVATAAFLQIGCPAPAPPTPHVAIEPPPAPPTAAPTAAPTSTAESAIPPLPEQRSPAQLPAWRSAPRDAVAACKAIEKAQEQASKKDASPPADSPGAVPPAPACIPTKSGAAWGLVQTVTGFHQNALNAVMQPSCGPGADGGPCLYDAELSLVPTHATPKGARATGAGLDVSAFSDGGVTGLADGFDFDGDGEEELIVPLHPSAILTFTGGKVTPYSAAKGLSFSGLVDADGDGRPDLLLDNPYNGNESFLSCGKWGGQPVLGFYVETSLIAHARPDGTFTTDDEVTQRTAKVLCPEKPSSIVLKEGAKYHHGWIRDNVVCARLWGASAEAVIAELDRDCKWPAEDECTALFEARDEGLTATCAGREELVKWANVTPPIVLR